MSIIGIVGSRDIDREAVRRLKQYIDQEVGAGDIIVSGHALGVDREAEQYALSMGLRVITFRPVNLGGTSRTPWAVRRILEDPVEDIYQVSTLPERYPGFAPTAFVRNGYIVELADRVACFWNGHSKGTKDSLRKAQAGGLPVDLFRVNAGGS